jgi:alkaline phosphatase
MKYTDGFVIAVKKGKLAEYKKMAELGARIWKKHGALEYFECVGDDLKPDMGGMKCLTFPQLTKLKKGETVVFSFIVYKNKGHRNKVNAKVMKDPVMNNSQWKDKPMPFDMKRMAYGGFKAIVEK